LNHTIVHFEIPANDVEKLKTFYSKLFNWKIEKVPGPFDYWLIETVPTDESGMPKEQGVNGGMMKKQDPDQRAANYISVESIDEYSKKVEQLGGRVIVPKREVTKMGYFAICIDPEGNVFALWQNISA
jgi:predicted enzyme related to lactoylglutathione lyase